MQQSNQQTKQEKNLKELTRNELIQSEKDLNNLYNCGKIAPDQYYKKLQEIQYLIMSVKDEYIESNKATIAEVIKLDVKKDISQGGTDTPLKRKTPKNKKQKVSEILTDEDIKELRRRKTVGNIITLLLCNTGIRVSELCDLKWSDVTDDYLIIRKGKGNKYREVPLNEEADTCLDWISNNLNTDIYVLETKEGKKYQRQYINKKLKAINPKFHPHLMRHTFITMMSKSGNDIKDISTIAGHSSVKTTIDVYMHPTKQDLKQSVNKLKL